MFNKNKAVTSFFEDDTFSFGEAAMVSGVLAALAGAALVKKIIKDVDKEMKEDKRTDEEFFNDLQNEYENMVRMYDSIINNYYVFTTEFNILLHLEIEFYEKVIFKFED